MKEYQVYYEIPDERLGKGYYKYEFVSFNSYSEAENCAKVILRIDKDNGVMIKR